MDKMWIKIGVSVEKKFNCEKVWESRLMVCTRLVFCTQKYPQSDLGLCGVINPKVMLSKMLPKVKMIDKEIKAGFSTFFLGKRRAEYQHIHTPYYCYYCINKLETK